MTTQAHISSTSTPRQRTRRMPVLPLLALLCVTLAAIAFMPLWEGVYALPGALLALIGMALFSWTIWRFPVEGITPLNVDAPGSAPLVRRDVVTFAAGMFLLAVLTVLQFVPGIPERVQVVLFFSGVYVLVWGAAGLRAGDVRGLLVNLRSTPRATWLPLTGIFTLALGARLWRLQDGLRVLVDEMQNIQPIVGMWDEPTPLLSQIDYLYYPYTHLHPYVQQVGSAIFGYSLYTLRLPNAVYGAFSVLALYWLVKLLFDDRQLALLSALILATFPFHLHFSRIGIMNLYDPTLAALAFGFAYRGVRGGLRRDWVFVGLLLGFTHYTYEGGRLLHTPMVLLWVALILLWYWFATGARPPFLRTLRGILWAVGLSLMIAAPIYITWLGMGSPLFGRLSAEAVDPQSLSAIEGGELSIGKALHNIRETMALYVTKPDEWMFYGGRQSLIPTFAQPFFFIGIVAALFYRRRWAVTVLPVLVLSVTVVLLGVFMRFTLYAARHTVAMLMMALVIALGVWWLSRLLFTQRRRQMLFAWVAALVLSAGQGYYYFNVHLPHYNLQARAVRGYADPDDAVFRARELPPDTLITVIRGEHRFPYWHPELLMHYITGDNSPQVGVWDEENVWEGVFADLDPTLNHAFFIESRNRDLIEMVFAQHPDAVPSFSDNPYVHPAQQFALIYIPKETLRD